MNYTVCPSSGLLLPITQVSIFSFILLLDSNICVYPWKTRLHSDEHIFLSHLFNGYIQEFEVDRKVWEEQASWNDLKMCAIFQNKQTRVKFSS